MIAFATRLIVAAFLLLALERPTHAYLDPGSGSMLLQVLLGGIAATAVVAKLFWHRVLVLLGLRSRDTEQ
jgi:hypothetical protein